MILKPVVPMECQPVRNSTAVHRMWIIRAKDLFSVLPLVLFLILVGCGGGSGTNSGDPGGTINLDWDSSTGPNLAGYKVYYGTASRAYSNSTDVGNVTTHAITGLTKGQTYFIAVTAYDTSHNETTYSDEAEGVAK
jgi:hypothetical protein